MKIETYLAKFFDVEIVTRDHDEGGELAANERHIFLYEKGESDEPIGRFVTFDDCDTYQWRKCYGKLTHGAAYTSAQVKDLAKRGAIL
jgi:hypothetical protein